MPEYDPVTKISIVPRGAAGGLTFFAPSDERLDSGLYRCGPCWCLLACRPFICTQSLYGGHVAMDLDRQPLLCCKSQAGRSAVGHACHARTCSRLPLPAACWHHLWCVNPSRADILHVTCSKSYLENQLAVALGGRVAEELIFGVENVTTGASNDFQQVGLLQQQASVRIKAICLSYIRRPQAAF